MQTFIAHRIPSIFLKVFLSVLVFVLCDRQGLAANSPVSETHDLDTAARELLNNFDNQDRLGVLVMDFQPSFGEPNSFGPWLADQLSTSLESQGGTLKLIDRSRIATGLESLHLPPDQDWTIRSAVLLGKSLAANTVILSSYGYAEGGIGITLAAFRVSELEAKPPTRFIVGMVFEKIPITQKLTAQLGGPLDALKPKDGVYRAGYGGVTIPVCIKCTPPRPHAPDVDLMGLIHAYPKGAAISLRFIVTPDGQTRNITVVAPIGFGFDAVVASAAADWQFKPAMGPDRKAVPVLFPFQFMFNFK
jgi:hypothetical protein